MEAAYYVLHVHQGNTSPPLVLHATTVFVQNAQQVPTPLLKTNQHALHVLQVLSAQPCQQPIPVYARVVELEHINKLREPKTVKHA